MVRDALTRECGESGSQGCVDKVSRLRFLNVRWNVKGEHGFVLRDPQREFAGFQGMASGSPGLGIHGEVRSVKTVGHRDYSNAEQAISDDVGDGITQATRVGSLHCSRKGSA